MITWIIIAVIVIVLMTSSGSQIVAKTDTRYADYETYCKEVYRAVMGTGKFSADQAAVVVGWAIKAQRGWRPNGKLWNNNLWGVKASPDYIRAGGKYFVASGSERDPETGAYTSSTMKWRAFNSLGACLNDFMKRFRGTRYIKAYEYLRGLEMIGQNECIEFANLLYDGGYFTADPQGWGTDVYVNKLAVKKTIGKAT